MKNSHSRLNGSNACASAMINRLHQAVVAVVTQVEHLSAPVLGVDEVQEAVVQPVHLLAGLLQRDRPVVTARLGGDDVVLVGERAAGWNQQADAAVAMTVHH